jgi:hypothetical protein
MYRAPTKGIWADGVNKTGGARVWGTRININSEVVSVTVNTT